MIKEKILIVEDERNICSFLTAVLTANNYNVIVAHTGAEAYTMITSQCPDLVLLDLGLPDIDGLSVVSAVRQWTHLPIVVVSARTHERDKVEALDRGADDYITKPFGTSELLARIRTAIRHTHIHAANESVAQTGIFKAGDMTIDYDRHCVLIREQDAGLTQSEYKIVALLGKYAGKVLTYDYILKELWGPLARRDNQILRVNMANIRRKIEDNPAEPKYIFTEVGIGYRMTNGE
ncbi:MAG: response regulator transcription factor [Clostridia bacterium]|jgi:two-component system KDP operon response regulator KdpE|nr:response regulator transcription factor [Clostridia bacterium]